MRFLSVLLGLAAASQGATANIFGTQSLDEAQLNVVHYVDANEDHEATLAPGQDRPDREAGGENDPSMLPEERDTNTPQILHDQTLYQVPSIKFIELGGEEFKWGPAEAMYPAYVSPYEMSAYEVTYQEYCDFLNAAYKMGYVSVSMQRAATPRQEFSNRIITAATGVYEGIVLYEGLDAIGYDEGAPRHDNAGKLTYDGHVFKVEKGFERRPASYITWFGARAFADFYRLRLPTEVQRQYGARCGQMELAYATDDGDCTIRNCNFNGRDTASGDEESGYPNMEAVGHPVDVDDPRYKPNPCGFYHLSGNVMEWCNDFYWEDYFEEPGPEFVNPAGISPDEFFYLDQGKYPRTVDRLNEIIMTSGRFPINGGAYNYFKTTAENGARRGGLGWLSPDHFGFRVARGGVTASWDNYNMWGEEHIERTNHLLTRMDRRSDEDTREQDAHGFGMATRGRREHDQPAALPLNTQQTLTTTTTRTSEDFEYADM